MRKNFGSYTHSFRNFWKIVGEHKQDHLHDWLEQVKNVGIIELKYFSQGLEKDIQAVETVLKYEWSNGPTEGQNNRLKMIKR